MNNSIKVLEVSNLTHLKIVNTEDLQQKSERIFSILGIKNPADSEKYELMSYLHEIS